MGDIPGQQWVRFAELETAPVYDLERMKKALAGPFFTVPDGCVTAEQFGRFVDDCAAGLVEPDPRPIVGVAPEER